MNNYQPIPIYYEGKLDRKYWYTVKAKQYLKEKGTVFAEKVDLIFEQHRLTPLDN